MGISGIGIGFSLSIGIGIRADTEELNFSLFHPFLFWDYVII